MCGCIVGRMCIYTHIQHTPTDVGGSNVKITRTTHSYPRRTEHPQQLRPHALAPQPPRLLERRPLERGQGAACAFLFVEVFEWVSG